MERRIAHRMMGPFFFSKPSCLLVPLFVQCCVDYPGPSIVFVVEESGIVDWSQALGSFNFITFIILRVWVYCLQVCMCPTCKQAPCFTGRGNQGSEGSHYLSKLYTWINMNWFRSQVYSSYPDLLALSPFLLSYSLSLRMWWAPLFHLHVWNA